jgi:inosine-uridine nucleoside N-ribohydrolase
MNFFRKILWKIRRVIIIVLIFSLAAGVVYVVVILMEKSRVPVFSAIIDVDTGKDISGILAISRALVDPKLKVTGLTSVQWNQSPEAMGKTVYYSQSLNDTLLRLFNKVDIPHPAGAERMLGYETGSAARPSEASEFIVEKANETPVGKKLNIIMLGAMTNLANAILSDSAIIPKIRVYCLAMHYDPAKKVWNKNEFNARNDLDALDLVLNTDQLEMHIMPVPRSEELVFRRDEVVNQLRNRGEPWSFIADQWLRKFHEIREANASEVALIEAILNPGYAKEEPEDTPPENKNRQVSVYTSVNTEFMKIDFWRAVDKYVSGNN